MATLYHETNVTCSIFYKKLRGGGKKIIKCIANCHTYFVVDNKKASVSNQYMQPKCLKIKKCVTFIKDVDNAD